MWIICTESIQGTGGKKSTALYALSATELVDLYPQKLPLKVYDVIKKKKRERETSIRFPLERRK